MTWTFVAPLSHTCVYITTVFSYEYDGDFLGTLFLPLSYLKFTPLSSRPGITSLYLPRWSWSAMARVLTSRYDVHERRP